MPAVVARRETCPLCGTDFDAEGQGCRPSCPLSTGCRVVCCPTCQYSFPQEVGLAGMLRRFLSRKEKGAAPAVAGAQAGDGSGGGH